MTEKPLVLVTGANGVIGRAVYRHLEERFRFRGIDRAPGEHVDLVADIADLDAIAAAFEGVHAVVHLAASVSVKSEWPDVLHNNLMGTYAVYEAARRAGAEAVVFASSNHTIGGYEMDGAPAIYALDDPRVYDDKVDLRPDSLYGVSKVYGEALGRYYHDAFGMRFYNLRIGTVRADDDPRDPSVAEGSFWLDLTPEQKYERMRATWLSQRDCAELIGVCLDRKDVTWATVYAISDNPRKFWDLTHTRDLLGWWPKDGAPE